MCDIHDVKEKQEGVWVYPYRCSRCTRCFLCQHELIGYEFWVCFDGYKKPAIMDSGVPC